MADPTVLFGWPLTATMCNLHGLRCEEASQFSVQAYIPCAKPAEALVWHDRDRRLYMMCHMCASHNIMNRGGRLVLDATKNYSLVSEVETMQKWKNWGNPYAR